MTLLPYLGIVLAVSLAVNMLLWNLRDAALEDKVEAQKAAQSAQAAGDLCTKATEKLVADAEARGKKAKIELAAAQQKAVKAEARALAVLSIRPVDPSDACKSAKALNRQMIEERKARK